MIKNIIFDFGDIFINLDKTATPKAMSEFGFTEITPSLDHLFKAYEKGTISTDVFLQETGAIFPNASKTDLIDAWNAILKDFPEYRLKFLQEFKKQHNYRLFLLSNTNDLHIEEVKKQMGNAYTEFQNCFEVFYLSYNMGKRKPDADIFEQVLQENNLIAEETFFIDDTQENTDTAAKLGMKTWNLLVGKEDIIDLKKHL
ncbi:HAD family phosphatase [Flavobacterium sp. ASW18X]|uniref:HAD family hydrolase n=1 Tax=Flavobacterium sp. ASW18X TaxID=2572595 RepID=UPI0010AECFD1|nr:HAD family phosphatase [Flavobacterium sp. ASW18X]TKD65831.1 HAD family phosphatase [Flavobacterium sp. ASW18X]